MVSGLENLEINYNEAMPTVCPPTTCCCVDHKGCVCNEMLPLCMFMQQARPLAHDIITYIKYHVGG